MGRAAKLLARAISSLDYKSLQNLGSGPDLDCVNGKEMGHFCCEKAAFFKHFGLQLDLDFTFEQIFGLSLKESGLDLDRKI